MQGIRGIRSGLAAALVMSAALAATLMLPAAVGAAVPDAPPKPLIGLSTGPKKEAAQGSYCWEGRNGAGLCADTIDPMTYAPTLRLARGADPIVRMGYPVKSVTATAGDEKLPLEPIAGSDRRFRLRLAEIPQDQKLKVYLFATYDRGDGFFAIKFVSRPR